MIKYSIPVYARMEKVLPTVGEVVTEVNETMEGFGFHEKMSVRGTIGTLTATAPVPFTREQALLYQETVQKEFDKQFDGNVWIPDFDEWQTEIEGQ